MGFAGCGNPPHSPPARARPCALVGGYMRGKDTSPCGGDVEAPPRHPSTAAFAGRWQSHFIRRRSRVVPYGSPGYRRLRRAPPSPAATPATRRAARHLGRLRTGAREYPVCAEGWAMWVTGGSPDLSQSHRGYLPVGEAAWLNLQVGPPLGALRRWLRGARAPDPARRRRSGECSGGKQMWPAARPAHAGRAARPRGPRARRPSNLVDSTALKHGRQALTGAR